MKLFKIYNDILLEKFDIEKSNLNDNFYKWFGNSKVVNNNGNPLICYHGTGADVKEFFKDKLGSRESYFFFTSNKNHAKEYGNYLISVYLKSERFIELDENYRDSNNNQYDTDSEDFRNKYNGFVVEKNTEWNEYVVFNPNQIKSINNDGSWDLNDNNIYS